MESKVRRIQRSKVLSHPLLGGGVRLLREHGLTDDKSHMSNAWCMGLKGASRWDGLPTRTVPVELTRFIYDETTQSIIIGSKAEDNTHCRTEM